MKAANGVFRQTSLIFRAVSVGVLFLVSVSTPCRATGTLDQEFVPTFSSSQSLWSDNSVGQIFTVGLNGTLTGFEVCLNNASSVMSDLDWEVQSTTSGVPDGTILASGTIAGTSISGTQWVSVDVSSAAIPVAVGDVYAIVMTGQVASPALRILWVADNVSRATYAGGERVSKTNPSGSWFVDTNVDFGFRTYVPEPSEAMLTFVALGTLLAAAGLRKRAFES